MLLLIRSMRDLQFGKLVQVYEESCPTLAAQSDFYEYLRQVFFKTPGAVYCVWQEGDCYTSALRLEPYQNGLLLTGLETAPIYRKHKFASYLLQAVLDTFTDADIYSHIFYDNCISGYIHRKFGFCKISDYAVFVDGSISRMAGTYMLRRLCFDDNNS